jgi:hypothetical protein
MGAEMSIEATKQIRIVSYEQLMDRTEKGRFVFVNKWDVCVQCDSFEEAKQLKETLAIAESKKQEPVAWRTEVKHGKLFFHIGNQSFLIDYTGTKEEIAWMEKQLQHALSKLASSPQRQEAEKQEPVAWRYKITSPNWTYSDKQPNREFAGDAWERWQTQPLYTSPPQRQPLTDEQIAEIAATPAAIPGSYVHSFARAIEAAHGITGEKK